MAFSPGTAVGWQGQGLTNSVSIAGYTITFLGTAALPCYFVNCTTVQESALSGNGAGIAGSSQWSAIKAAFTRFSASGDVATIFTAQPLNAAALNTALDNCEIWSGLVGGVADGGLHLTCNNCLFDRTTMVGGDSLSGAYISLQNCTLNGGRLTVNNFNNHQSVRAYDSAFDGTVITINNPNGGNFSGQNDAYLSGATTLPNEDIASDQFVFGSFNWQSGLLGNFYLPANSPLVDTGDKQASDISVIVNTPIVGSWNTDGSENYLDAFTTQTNQAPDFGAVDIGYHYPANPPLLLGQNANWHVWLEADPAWLEYPWDSCGMLPKTLPYDEGFLQAPFGSGYNISTLHTISPPINNCWPNGDSVYDPSIMKLETIVYIPNNVDLSKIKFFVAIDNYFSLTVNGYTVGGWDSDDLTGGAAKWMIVTNLNNIFQACLQPGNNYIQATVEDYGEVDYFDMIITTNAWFPIHGPLY